MPNFCARGKKMRGTGWKISESFKNSETSVIDFSTFHFVAFAKWRVLRAMIMHVGFRF